VSQAAVWDVHGGDIETATINEFYPRLADTEKAKSLPDVPLPDHTDVEIPVGACIRDNPPTDPINNVQYNFLFIIPAVDTSGNDIVPFQEAGAIYDVILRFFPSVGGKKFVATRTIRVECV